MTIEELTALLLVFCACQLVFTNWNLLQTRKLLREVAKAQRAAGSE